MRILVVEDYDPLRTAVAQLLREEGGYNVEEAKEGPEARDLILAGEFDVIVLDLMLPGLDGIEVLRQLREAGKATCVLILTARDTIEDRVKGLDLGADDYLVKPFAMEELLARVRALVRRNYDRPSPTIEIGTLQVNTNDRSATIGGQRIDLTAREYALLEYLANRAGEVVTRTEILHHVFNATSGSSSNVVDVYVGYLRKKLESTGCERILHTRRGAGYLLSSE